MVGTRIDRCKIDRGVSCLKSGGRTEGRESHWTPAPSAQPSIALENADLNVSGYSTVRDDLAICRIQASGQDLFLYNPFSTGR